MPVYLNKFLPEKKIVGNSHEKQYSIVCREWLSYFKNPNICREGPIFIKDVECNIHGNKVGKKLCQYYNLSRPFTVDRFDKKNKTVYLFQGCCWHGCRKCNPESELKYDDNGTSQSFKIKWL